MNDSDISLTNIGHGHEQGLALSPNTSKQQVALAACSNDPALRIAAAYHPALASNLRQQLAQDTDPAVRDAARNSLLATDDERAASYAFAFALTAA